MEQFDDVAEVCARVDFLEASAFVKGVHVGVYAADENQFVRPMTIPRTLGSPALISSGRD